MKDVREVGEPGELGAFVQPKLSEARMARQWSAIDGRIGRTSSVFRPFYRWAGAAALLATVASVVVWRTWPTTNDNGTVASAGQGAQAPTKVALADGSEVTIAPAGRIEVDRDQPENVHLTVQTGSAHFSVKHDTTRPFIVEAGDVAVRVVGTEFTVTRERDESGVEHVRVEVDKGIVEVSRKAHPSEPRRLHAGEAWTSRDTPNVETTAALADPSVTPPSSPPPTGALPTAVSARSLFESANAARRSGNVALAAQHYRDLVSRFPDDPRAKLAAFELGRLEIELGRSDDAEKALEKATKGAKGSAVHEDALAKLVGLYNQRNQSTECKRAQSEYLRLYPKGVHAEVVRVSCSNP